MSEPAGNLTHDPSTNAPPPEVPKMPVAPDAVTLEAALRGGEHADFLKKGLAWIASVDRIPPEIKDGATAGAVAKTITELVKFRTGAEARHAAAKKPWLDATRVFDAVFLTPAKAAEAAQKKAVAIQKKWIAKEAEEATKRAQEEARKAEEEATRLREVEEEKMREAERAMDTGDMDKAQDLMQEAAQHHEAAAEHEETAQVQTAKAEGPIADQVRTHHNIGVTTSAKKFWDAELLPIDGLTDEAQLKFWRALAPYIAPADRLKAAKAAVKAGLRDCPGLKIFEDFTPINR